MPLIIDANRSSDFRAPISGHAPEILIRIAQKRVKVTVGGKLTEELSKTPLRMLLAEWIRSGCVIRIKSDDLNAEISGMGGASFKSNDSHVIVLARVSGTRLPYTDDNDLIVDFKDKRLLNPRGKVMRTTIPGNIVRPLLNRFGT